jgi:hypothetical protein
VNWVEIKAGDQFYLGFYRRRMADIPIMVVNSADENIRGHRKLEGES